MTRLQAINLLRQHWSQPHDGLPQYALKLVEEAALPDETVLGTVCRVAGVRDCDARVIASHPQCFAFVSRVCAELDCARY